MQLFPRKTVSFALFIVVPKEPVFLYYLQQHPRESVSFILFIVVPEGISLLYTVYLCTQGKQSLLYCLQLYRRNQSLLYCLQLYPRETVSFILFIHSCTRGRESLYFFIVVPEGISLLSIVYRYCFDNIFLVKSNLGAQS